MAIAAMDTKVESYRRLENLGDKQQRVLDTLKARGPMSDRQLMQALNWPVNCVHPRRNELVAFGLVRRSGSAYDAESNRTVALWEAA